MNKIFLFGLMLVATAFAVSCNLSGSSPDKIFSKIGLNGNKIPTTSFHRHFKEMRAQKAMNRLIIVVDGETKPVSVSEYVDYHYKNMFEDDIKGIRDLASDEESKPIIEAGLAMFLYADEIYKNDFTRIAKMIDEGKTDEEIKAAIDELDNTKGAELDQKYQKTMDILLPYADKHGVEYNTIEMP